MALRYRVTPPVVPELLLAITALAWDRNASLKLVTKDA
jgi:hypothetical protein